MKKITSGILILIIGTALFTISCKKHKDDVVPASNTSDPIAAMYTSQQNSKQRFTVNPIRDTVLTGINGTKLYIGGNTLCTSSGQPVTGDVTIELKELTHFSDMVLNNAPTVSNGKLLKSGGSFYVAANQNGTPLTLAAHANYFIEVAAPYGTSDSMKVFTGKDSSGVIAWTPVETDTVNTNIEIPDTTANKSPYDSAAYFTYYNTSWAIRNDAYTYMVKCTSFGWINADYFIEMNYSDLCEQTVICDPSLNLDIAQTSVYYLLPATNSCASLYATSVGFIFKGGIPNKESIKIVALANKDGKCYISVMDHFVNCDDTKTVVLYFTEIQESDIPAALEKINI